MGGTGERDGIELLFNNKKIMTVTDKINQNLNSFLLRYLNDKPKGVYIHPKYGQEIKITKVELVLVNADYSQDAETKEYQIKGKTARAFVEFTSQTLGMRKDVFSFEIREARIDADYNIVEPVELFGDWR